MAEEDTNGIEASTPWGIGIKAHGKIVIICGCILALAALELYIEAERKIDRQKDREEHEEIAVQMRINNYLISLPVEDRPRLIAPTEIWGMLAPESTEANPVKTPFILKHKETINNK